MNRSNKQNCVTTPGANAPPLLNQEGSRKPQVAAERAASDSRASRRNRTPRIRCAQKPGATGKLPSADEEGWRVQRRGGVEPAAGT
jgi:hypothetical protein